MKPNTRWAQRKDIVYLSLDLADVKNEKVELTENKLSFSGRGGSSGQHYELVIDFFEEVAKEGSKWAIHGKSTEFVIKKKVKRFLASINQK
jgi:prostaglandin-E synthase